MTNLNNLKDFEKNQNLSFNFYWIQHVSAPMGIAVVWIVMFVQVSISHSSCKKLGRFLIEIKIDWLSFEKQTSSLELTCLIFFIHQKASMRKVIVREAKELVRKFSWTENIFQISEWKWNQVTLLLNKLIWNCLNVFNLF